MYKAIPACLLVCLTILFACREPRQRVAIEGLRVVSLSPAITDIIVRLGASDQLAGITGYCEVPPGCKARKVGTLLDVNMELIYSLEPGIIFTSPYHQAITDKFTELGLPYEIVPMDTVAQARAAILTVAGKIDRLAQGKAMLRKMDAAMADIGKRAEQGKRKRIIVVVGRPEGPLRSVTVVGGSNFLNELVQIAGGSNLFADNLSAYPMVPASELFRLQPELVIELFADRLLSAEEKQKRLQDWSEGFGDLPPLKVKLLNRTDILRPGPAMADIVRELFYAIHPEQNAKE